MFGNLLPVFLCIDHSDTDYLDKISFILLTNIMPAILPIWGVIKSKAPTYHALWNHAETIVQAQAYHPI